MSFANGLGPVNPKNERRTEVFGIMNTEPLLRLNDAISLEAAVGALLKLTENTRVARWVQFPSAVLLFLVVPNDPASGAFYVFERRTRTWIWVDFEDQAYGGYNVADFDTLVRDCRFLRLVEQPALLRRTQRWLVQPGMDPQSVV
jgi:hypothetical protein